MERPSTKVPAWIEVVGWKGAKDIDELRTLDSNFPVLLLTVDMKRELTDNGVTFPLMESISPRALLD